MDKIAEEYRISIYGEITELSQDKVYIVKSSLDNRIYVKKILPIENSKIYTEIKKLNIPNIPRIYEIIELDDKLVVIEEYINGHSLGEILEDYGVLPEKKVVKCILDLIDILNSFYHSSLTIIHRDIKPSNIMINNDGILKLIDFDISRIHKTDKSTDTDILGTYGYAAPEQFGFNQSDVRTDIYSIGATMNILLTGKLPMEELYKGRLARIISKCIELDPKKRYQNIGELKNDLLKRCRKYDTGKRDYASPKLPGFNSNLLIFRVIGFLWYSLLALILLGFLDKEPVSRGRVSDIIFSLLAFSLTLLYGNYKDIKSRLPIVSSSKPMVQLLGYILYTVVLFTIFGIINPQ